MTKPKIKTPAKPAVKSAPVSKSPVKVEKKVTAVVSATTVSKPSKVNKLVAPTKPAGKPVSAKPVVVAKPVIKVPVTSVKPELKVSPVVTEQVSKLVVPTKPVGKPEPAKSMSMRDMLQQAAKPPVAIKVIPDSQVKEPLLKVDAPVGKPKTISIKELFMKAGITK